MNDSFWMLVQGMAPLLITSLLAWLVILSRARRFPYEPRRPVPWGGDLVLLLGFMLFAFQSLGVVAVAKASNLPLEEAVHDLRVMTFFYGSQLIWLLMAVAFAMRLSGATTTDLGLVTNRIARDFGLGLLVLLAALGPVYLVQLPFAYWAPTEHPVQALLKVGQPAWFIVVTVISAGIVIPAAEELLFRVLLQGWLEKVDRQGRRKYRERWPRRGIIPVTCSSLVFGLLHIGTTAAPIFVLALFLGYAYWRTHRIWPSLVAHAGFNAITLVTLLAQRPS